MVAHGYCVVFGARTAPARASSAAPHVFLHIAETDAKTVTSGAASAGGGVANPAIVKLGNYRAVFMLAGASAVVMAIDAILAGREPGGREQTLLVLDAGGMEFVIGERTEPDRSADRSFRDQDRFMFAVQRSLALSFLEQLTLFIRGRREDLEPQYMEPWLLPEPGQAALFPDGLAVLSPPFPAQFGALTWSPYDGLRL